MALSSDVETAGRTSLAEASPSTTCFQERVAFALTLVGLVITAVAVRLPFLDVPMISDEGGYSYVARFWNDSYRLYRDIPFDRPQGIFLIYKAIFALLGDDVVAIRLGAAICNAATTVAVLLFVRESTGSLRGAGLAGLLFALVSTSPRIEGFTANAELFTVLPLVIGAWLTWRRGWLSAGALAGVAFLIKPIGIAGLVLAGAWIWHLRAGWRALAMVLLGCGGILLLAFAHIATLGLSEFWIQQESKMLALSAGPEQLSVFLGSVSRTYPAWLGVAMLAVLGLHRASRDIRLFGAIWLVASLGGMAMGQQWSAHYWVQAIPALSWLSGHALAHGSNRTGLLRVLSIGVVCVSLVHQAVYWSAEPKAVSWALYKRPGYLVQDEIASYVRANTDQDDMIFVAFWEAAVYALAQRRASPPHLYQYEYLATRRAYDEVVEAIRGQSPTLVIWVNRPPLPWASAEEFRRTLEAAGYESRRSIGHVLIYGRSVARRAK